MTHVQARRAALGNSLRQAGQSAGEGGLAQTCDAARCSKLPNGRMAGQGRGDGPDGRHSCRNNNPAADRAANKEMLHCSERSWPAAHVAMRQWPAYTAAMTTAGVRGCC